jgi:hypothetical protein
MSWQSEREGAMAPSKFVWAMVAIAAVAIALLVFLAAALYLPGSSHKYSGTRFSLPGTLATLPVNASNPDGCGTNHTDYLSLSAHSWVAYQVSVNATGDTVRFWVVGGSGSGGPTLVEYGHVSPGTMRLGSSNVTVSFVFQGCGTSASVPYGFWGNYTLGGVG